MPNTTPKPAEHTPWHIGMNPGPIIYNSKGDQIADLRDETFFTNWERTEHALSIIKSHNAHAGLVEALAGLVGSLDSENKAAPWAVRTAKAAIAQATEDKG